MRTKGLDTRKLTTLAIFVSLSMILSFVESQIPAFVAIPGIKIGLANSVSLILLFVLGAKYAFICSILRVSLSSLLFGTPISFIYSIAGAIASLAVMWPLSRLKLLSPVSVSAVGGVCHNLAQIAVAALMFESRALVITYLPPLLLSGTVAGVVIGILTGLLIPRIKKLLFKQK